MPDNNSAVLEALMEGLLLRGQDAEQLTLDLGVQEKQAKLYTEWESTAERERQAQTKYAQHAIKPQEVSAEVTAARASLGTREDVAVCMEHALRALHSTITPAGDGFTATLSTLPLGLRDALPRDRNDPLTFADDLPVRRGDAVLNRTDASVEAISQYVLESALDSALDPVLRPARRCAVIRTESVLTRTTLLVVRYRFHLELPSRSGNRELIAEDVAILAFQGAPAQAKWLDQAQATALLAARPSGNVPPQQAAQFISRAIDGLPELASHLDETGQGLADRLLAAHRRVRQASSEIVRGVTVTPERGADVLGVFVFVPPIQEASR